jgi:hypothetical protein
MECKSKKVMDNAQIQSLQYAQIEESDAQDENAPDSICDSLEPASNATLQSAPHVSKHFVPSVSTEDGMQIAVSEDQNVNPACSICKSREPKAIKGESE